MYNNWNESQLMEMYQTTSILVKNAIDKDVAYKWDRKLFVPENMQEIVSKYVVRVNNKSITLTEEMRRFLSIVFRITPDDMFSIRFEPRDFICGNIGRNTELIGKVGAMHIEEVGRLRARELHYKMDVVSIASKIAFASVEGNDKLVDYHVSEMLDKCENVKSLSRSEDYIIEGLHNYIKKQVSGK